MNRLNELTFNYQFFAGPFFHLSVRNTTVSVIAGSEVDLRCKVQFPSPMKEMVRTFWVFNGKLVDREDQHYKMSWDYESNQTITQKTLSLKIQNISQHDGGHYYCSVNRTFKDGASVKGIYVDVIIDKKREKGKPMLTFSC